MKNIEKSQVNEPILKKNNSISPFWIFTLLAFLMAGWLLYKSVNDAGQRIEIFFDDAQGINAGRTTIRYQGLEVGIIRRVTLSDDLKSISAQADIYPDATKILRENTVFWVVRPKATITGISGLDALVTGNYIAVQPGTGSLKTIFIAADSPPKDLFIHGNRLHIQLEAPDLGSINIGSGVYFKKVLVGEVYDYQLNPNKQNVTLLLRIKKEHASLVTNKSLFWNVSGISAKIGLTGIDVNVGNLATVIAGGIAFDSPAGGIPATHLETYKMYDSINATNRGITVSIALPRDHGITNAHSAILYQGLEIGRLNGIHFDPSFSSTIANANIDPSMAWMLKSGSEFIIETAQLNLEELKNISNLFLGNSLTLQPGEGTDSRKFTAKTTQSIIANDPRSLKVKLQAENAWGLGENTTLIYRGFQVGFVNKINLKKNNLDLELVIYPKFSHLVKSNSRFFIVGGITGQVNAEGIEFMIPALSQLAEPSISFTSEGENTVNDAYPLFKSEIQARNAKDSAQGYKEFTLIANKLPSVSEGSPVMYKNFTVGKVKKFELARDRVEVIVQIENQYRHLVTPETVFWNHSGIDIRANLSGIEIDTGSLKSIISGGISFGMIKGIENRKGDDWKLYKSFIAAQNYGLEITFTSHNANGLSEGSNIRYQGINVGEVTSLAPAFKRDGVTITAIIYPEYSDKLAKKTSYFWIATPTFSLTKTENLDSLFSAYILVSPGKGKKKVEFKLNDSAQYADGLTLVLESENRDSVSKGTPIFFRDIEVGSVTDVSLGRFADRVLIEIKISDDYKYLVRNNTVFWNQSGIDVTLGLTGATIHTGTLESIIRGGISFATPEEELEKSARSNQHFLLHKESKTEWTRWRTAIPHF